MKTELFNTGWKFREYGSVAGRNAEWREVTLPHDAVIATKRNPNQPEGTKKGYFENGSWEYVKVFAAKKEWNGKRVQILFDGVQNHAAVFLNGNCICHHAYGYTHFAADLTEYLRSDKKNVLKVICKTGNDSRWYNGGGIYRDVFLCVGDENAVPLFGVKIKTVFADKKKATINISVDCKGIFTAEISKNGKTVAKTDGCGSVNADIDGPLLWSDKTPELYTCKITTASDIVEETFGIRTLSVSSKTGLLVNGKEVKLRGGCIHHDSGFLGVKTVKEYEYRRVRKLKEAGFNALRMAHHPASRYLLEACDYYGVYVMDEAFDMWDIAKSPDDYSNDFRDNWRADVKAMTDKDYNHPSVVMYSVGNEISDLAFPRGAETARAVSEEVKRLDDTRFTTVAMNGILHLMANMELDGFLSDNKSVGRQCDVNEQMNSMDDVIVSVVNTPAMDETLLGGAEAVDIAGYNYMYYRYGEDKKKYPERVIVGSETYLKDIPAMWDYIKENHNVIGDFTWTAWDYLGETGIGLVSYKKRDYHDGFYAVYPCVSGYCGDIDLAGNRLPQSFWREIVFGLRKEPYIAVHNPAMCGKKEYTSVWGWDDVISSWAFSVKEGTPLTVDVYGNGEIELFVNGRSFGKKDCGKNRKTSFVVPYEKGEIKAVCGEHSYTLKSGGKEKNILLTVEKTGRLIFAEASIVDENGTVLTDKNTIVKISVTGGKLLGFGSAEPLTEESYCDDEHTTYRGKALAIIESDGKTEIEISAEGFNATRWKE